MPKNGMRQFVSVAVLGLAAFACHSASSESRPPATDAKLAVDPAALLDEAKVALDRADWSGAESRLRALLQDPRASAPLQRSGRLVLAEVLFETGRLSELLALAGGAELSLWQLRALLSRGEPGEVVRLSEADPSPEARLVRAEALLELGRRPEAETVLRSLVEGWPRADGTESTPEFAEKQRTVARAAFLLRDPKGANALFGEVAEVGSPSARSRLWEAELFLERHDPKAALAILSAFLERAPLHPEALLLFARLKAEESFDFVGAAELAEQVLAISPAHPGALFILASLALQDMDFEASSRALALGLKRNPRSAELLSLSAGQALLEEKPDEFERRAEQFLALAPDSARLFSIVSELAEWEHRYADIEAMTRRAVRLDPKDPKVRARLAMTLLRSGSEAQGLVELRRAFELDPYDVRTYNTLTLFEQVIPEQYETHELGNFRFRFPKEEAKLLLRYVPDLAREAAREYEKRYKMPTPRPITIELYRNRQEFGVRTSGLTHIGLEGVCFGQRVAALSPKAGPGNLGMTLWHEMAHVFHLTASKGRIPRWLTEGFAEWETARLARGWNREAERALFAAERKGASPEFFRMNQAFTRARSHSDIAAAYFVSGALAQFLDETNPELFPRWLPELGERRLATDVMRASLPDPASIMERFRAHLGERLRRFETQFVVDEGDGLVGEELAPLLPAGSPRETSPEEEAAFALAAAGELAAAQRALFDLWQAKPIPRVGLALARLASRAQDLDGARELLDRSIEVGPDGVQLRLERARLASALGDFPALRDHARRATELDPEETEGWVLLAAAEHGLGSKEGELAALVHWAELDETSATAHQRLLELLLDAGRFSEAARAADRALWVALGRPRIHELAALAFEKAGNPKRAAFERETLRLLTPNLASH